MITGTSLEFPEDTLSAMTIASELRLPIERILDAIHIAHDTGTIDTLKPLGDSDYQLTDKELVEVLKVLL